MSFLKGIVDRFRSVPRDQSSEKVDRYGILSPLLATSDYVKSTHDMCKIAMNEQGNGAFIADTLTGKTKPTSVYVEKSVHAYNDYVRHLPNQAKQMERVKPLSSVMLVLENISGNFTAVEDNFQAMFGQAGGDRPEQNIKASSLVVIGYLEKSDNFCTWFCNLFEHLTADQDDLIPPFRTRELLTKAGEATDFAALNLDKWNTNHNGLLGEVKNMQTKGADLPIQAATGEWIDQYGHDSQYSLDEKDLIVAAFRNPMLMLINRDIVRTQARIELLSARKEWLTAKIIQAQSKARGMDVNSPEYKKQKRAIDKYASIISQYEQKIERMRG